MERYKLLKEENQEIQENGWVIRSRCQHHHFDGPGDRKQLNHAEGLSQEAQPSSRNGCLLGGHVLLGHHIRAGERAGILLVKS